MLKERIARGDQLSYPRIILDAASLACQEDYLAQTLMFESLDGFRHCPRRRTILHCMY